MSNLLGIFINVAIRYITPKLKVHVWKSS